MAENFIAEAFSLLAVGLVVIGFRLYSRIVTVGYRRLAADDYLMIVAGCLYSAETVAAYVVGAYWQGLANNSMTPEQRAALDPAGKEWHLRVKGSQNQLFGWLVYTCLLWTLKTCMLIFFTRLTDNVTHMKLHIRIGAVFLATTFLATFLTILLGCYPIKKHWQINPDPGNHCQPAVSKLQVAVLIVLNISTDFYLMSIPIPMIWKSRLAPKKKWALSVMFSGGLLIMIFGLLRCILILTSGANGAEQAGEWSIRESFVAVTVNNLPMLYSLFQYLIRRSERSGHHISSHKLPSYRSGDSTKKHSKKFRHPLSVPNDTANGSDEQIMQYGPNMGYPHGISNGYGTNEADAYSTPITRSGSLHKGKIEDDRRKGIQVRTDLSVQSTEKMQEEEQVMARGLPLQKPPPGYARFNT